MGEHSSLSKPMQYIAFQGVAGAHSDLACRKAYPYMQTKAYSTFEAVFEAVEKGEAELGMIPIENTYAGRVAEIHSLLPLAKVHIVAEHFQRVEHYLMAPKGAKLEDITDVYSHPQALLQCRDHLLNMNVRTQQFSNTAAAAEAVANWNDKSKAAISSPLAAELYGLEVLQSNIEDQKDNTTIFLVISKAPVHPDHGVVITTLVFGIRNIPAALYKSLGGFATNNVNLLKIESYIKGGHSREAQFYVSFVGHPGQKNVQYALEELGFFTQKLKVLGVYQAAPERQL